MKRYLKTLIEEKGRDLDDEIIIDGHIGLTYRMLVDYIHEAKRYHRPIRNALVTIDFRNGDVFHYLDYLAKGMVENVFGKVA